MRSRGTGPPPSRSSPPRQPERQDAPLDEADQRRERLEFGQVTGRPEDDQRANPRRSHADSFLQMRGSGRTRPCGAVPVRGGRGLVNPDPKGAPASESYDVRVFIRVDSEGVGPFRGRVSASKKLRGAGVIDPRRQPHSWWRSAGGSADWMGSTRPCCADPPAGRGQRRLRGPGLPGPRVAEPQCRQHVQRRLLRAMLRTCTRISRSPGAALA